MVIGTPDRKTTAAASGSARMLNSANGAMLPRPVEPPISTIRSTLPTPCSSQVATLVSGPVATIVAGSLRTSVATASAPRGSASTAGGGKSGPSRPDSP